MPPTIYLASQSPRRSQLLTQLGVEHTLLLPAEDEDAEALEVVLPGEAPLDYVQRVVALKLEAAMQRLQRRALPAAPVLCADTTVALGASIMGKPVDAAHAICMLQALAGKSHHVMTAISVSDGTKIQSACSVSEVTFASLSSLDIQNYVSTGEPMGKAGAYAVQGRAGGFIMQINGSYSGIMGLPLFETAQILRSLT